jgi:hypothetical protein
MLNWGLFERQKMINQRKSYPESHYLNPIPDEISIAKKQGERMEEN